MQEHGNSLRWTAQSGETIWPIVRWKAEMLRSRLEVLVAWYEDLEGAGYPGAGQHTRPTIAMIVDLVRENKPQRLRCSLAGRC